MRVLVVEDDALIRQVAVSLFKRLNCQTTTASQGEEALSHFSTEWDVVFMDCQMPVLDGFAATRRWRDLETQRNPAVRVPIIALTGETSESEKQKCLAAGMDDFVSKPLRLDTLRELLERWSGKKSAPVAPASENIAAQPEISPADPLETLIGEYIGYELLLRQMALTYAAQWPQTGAQLRVEIEKSNAPGVFQLAHKFKGQTQTLHCESLARLAQKLEDNARRGELLEMAATLEPLSLEIEAGLDWLRDLVARLDAMASR